MSFSLDISKAAKAVTVQITVKGVRRFRARLFATGLVLRLAGLISPLPIEIEIDNEART
jgi:hypothetical protein